MTTQGPYGSVFHFELCDNSIRECRPLVDPLPAPASLTSGKMKTFAKVLPIQGGIQCGTAWRIEAPHESVPSSPLGAQKGKVTPAGAGSPSFARRPIPNGHFQMGDQFKPSIRIHQPPGGVDRIWTS